MDLEEMGATKVGPGRDQGHQDGSWKTPGIPKWAGQNQVEMDAQVGAG